MPVRRKRMIRHPVPFELLSRKYGKCPFALCLLFPPENATGNYIKVVQRIPVKIVLEKGTDPKYVLRIGMSVAPTILVE
jgi:hypothetical protein